jgi:signal transduction histidine kinase
VLGLLAAAVSDPRAAGCGECPRNLLALGADAGASRDVTRAGMGIGLAWALLVIVVALRGLVVAAPGRRRVTAPVVAAGCAYLALVAAGYARAFRRGGLDQDGVDRALWLAEGAALCLLAAAVATAWLVTRVRRSRLARLAVDLATPSGGSLRDALAATLSDPSLQLAYPVQDGRLTDASGTRVELEGQLTPVVRQGVEVAFLAHRAGLLDEPGLAQDVASATALRLEHERLQAHLHARLNELTAARSRIVDAGDAERQRLERDLHDGAQQQLVGLALALGLEGLRAPSAARRARIEAAEREVRAALAELRELASGMFPALLAEAGLGVALEALAEEAPGRLALRAVPAGRFPRRVEAAAYFVVAEAVRRHPPSAVVAAVALDDAHVVVEVEGAGRPHAVDIEDRVRAVEGRLSLRQEAESWTMRAELPCGS